MNSEESNSKSSESMAEDGEIFEVDRVIDIRWGTNSNGRERLEYRVRWKYYKPIDDTWEPPEHFEEDCGGVLREFHEKYEKMKEEKSNYFHEIGREATSRSLFHVNILSKEIEQITEKTTVKEGQKSIMVYHVTWLGCPKSDSTWESEIELAHAKDKIDMFLHKKRVQKGKRKGRDLPDFVIPDHERQVNEREFYKATETRTVLTSGSDLYSIVKGRRSSQKINKCENQEKQSKRGTQKETGKDYRTKTYGNLLSGIDSQKASSSKQSDACKQNITVKIESDIEIEDPFEGNSILAGLIPYDPEHAKKDLEEQMKHTLILTEAEFCDAADMGDYDTVFASMRSERIPDVDFTSLFLKASRRGQRDLALLLSTHAPDLLKRDEWGDNALTIAAKLGDVCFAHYLLLLDVPVNECNSLGHTAREIAIKLGHIHFLKFLQEYESGII
ncbi:M-phase phosphoprotein 8-like isoform X3 [Penaeus chinensis]|uniref:M-phase phosphoprotein 8-like isoform X2 n=1 Tax=Penaeus chinensis TaxID=139456 RepID=UPI001FB69F2A|nr:M-phase phosphoprotein 8-like isoform X2 [Penaeus chinensis]XP_047496198.1 M-phase phosphoprotein 8-like isoform X3 [Penaeus chinensis]